jgi:hypothetical protein
LSRASRHSQHPFRKPSKLTIAVTGGTVLAAAAATSVVTLLPATPAGSAADQLTAVAGAGGRSAWPGASSGNSVPSLNQRPRQSQVLLAEQVAAQQAAARRLAAARAAAAARQRAAQEKAAQEQQAQQAQATAAAAPSGPSGSPQQIAEGMLASYGWSSSQFSCLNSLWNVESGWSVTASNPSSGAYGIPQALPGSKMASAGPDWQTDAATQIRWGLNYIKAQYGSPCGAWGHEESDGWY